MALVSPTGRSTLEMRNPDCARRVFLPHIPIAVLNISALLPPFKTIRLIPGYLCNNRGRSVGSSLGLRCQPRQPLAPIQQHPKVPLRGQWQNVFLLCIPLPQVAFITETSRLNTRTDCRDQHNILVAARTGCLGCSQTNTLNFH